MLKVGEYSISRKLIFLPLLIIIGAAVTLLYGINGKTIVNVLWFMMFIVFCLQIANFIGRPLLLAVCILAGAEIFIRFKYGDFSTGMLESILATNKNEAKQVLATNLLNIFVVFLLVIFVFATLTASYKRQQKKAWILYACFLGLSLGIIYRDYIKPVYKHGEYCGTEIRKNFDSLMVCISRSEKVTKKFQAKYPIILGNFVYAIYFINSNSWLQNFVQNIDARRISHESIFGLDKENRVKNIVLIMSESSCRNYYNVYGYKGAATTPNMKILAEKEKLSVCKNVHSPANITRTSVPLNLSFASPGAFGSGLFMFKTVINLAKDAGYKTFWLATQDSGGLIGYGNTYEIVSRACDEVVSPDIKNEKFGEVRQDDTISIDLLKKAFKYSSDEDYKFMVLHWVGNHAPYRYVYNDVDDKALPNAGDYDKSIHKSDRLFAEIYQFLEDLGSDYLLIFTADHGEIPYDEGAGVEHGLTYGGYGQYEIPYIIASKDSRIGCSQLDRFRYSSGQFSGLFTKFHILENMGYKFNSNNINMLRGHDLVLHSDGKVYEYEKIPTLKDKNR